MSKKRLGIVVAALVYIALFLFLERYDYPLSVYLTSHANSAVIWIGARFGSLPPFLLMAFSLYILGSWNQSLRFLKLAAHVILTLAAVMVFRPWAADNQVLSGILSIVFAVVLIAVVETVPIPEKRQDIIMIPVFVILFTVITLAIINVMKFTWGRPRFYALDLLHVEFRRWYEIEGFKIRSDHYCSFPSAHTASATLLICCVHLTKLYDNKHIEPPYFWALGIIIAILVAFTRIMAGMHFLSDVMAGFAICVAVFLLLEKIFLMKGWIFHGKQSDLE